MSISKKTTLTALAVCCLLAGVTVCSQPPRSDITVGDLDLSDFRWGEREASFTLANNTEELRFVTVEMQLQSAGAYLSPSRSTKSHHILVPRESRTVSHTLFIPGVVGQAEVVMRIYDVVDTLDIILPGQKFFEKSFDLKFEVPDALQKRLDERITLPPMVDHHPLFDNEFTRLLLVLLHEGRSVDEIAAMAGADTSFVRDIVRQLVSDNFVRLAEGKHQLAFPFIDSAEVEQVGELARELARSLTATIARNMSNYDRVLDSLVAVGTVSPDSNTFMDGGVVLYRKYPVVSTLLLWFRLGREFITDTLPLTIYADTDPCNAHIPNFMYAVHGKNSGGGEHFYMLNLRFSNYQILFGDQVPQLECGSDFASRSGHRRPVSWGYVEPYVPETFMLDTVAVRPVLDELSRRIDEPLNKAKKQLVSLSARHGRDELTKGYLYWFWNTAATETLNALVDQGVVTRRGNGLFKMDGVPPAKR